MKILKNVALVMALLIFAFGILGTSIWQTVAQSASENYRVVGLGEEGMGESVQGQATVAAEEEVNYSLAYPGILPDHLLYPLKMVRDRIMLFLTTDPLKKAELYLLFADKRLEAGRMLIEKDKLDLGLETLTKAEKYLEQAVEQEKVAQQAGKKTEDFLNRLSLATRKHEQVMLGFEEKMTITARPVYEKALQYAREGQQRVRERREE
ncbi:MAG: DUF5667 domain-containing protein [Candidatus Marinimicrobia bacterium]|nr:DUF5667 domain-containing protein [Candidatus Neomarinimicrobiota bacterium]